MVRWLLLPTGVAATLLLLLASLGGHPANAASDCKGGTMSLAGSG